MEWWKKSDGMQEETHITKGFFFLKKKKKVGERQGCLIGCDGIIRCLHLQNGELLRFSAFHLTGLRFHHITLHIFSRSLINECLL